MLFTIGNLASGPIMYLRESGIQRLACACARPSFRFLSSATQLLVESYDPTILADIASAIQEADIGLTPNNDGRQDWPLTDGRIVDRGG